MSDTIAPPTTRFTYVPDWQVLGEAEAEAIRGFWRREGALADGAPMEARLKQVVMHALSPEGEVAGVCTAAAATPPQLGQPVWYWRTFVGVRWRSTPLVMNLLKRSCTLLGDHARANDWPCIGILLELENTRFRDKGRAAVWWNPRFTYIGRSARGLDLRVHYFHGARLKPPPPA